MKRAVKAVPDRIDIRAVAARAEVSIATVSRTINHLPNVTPALATRVWKAVAELDYTPSPQARALVSGRSRLLGLVVSDITNPFFPELIHRFEESAVERRYEILIGSSSYEPQRADLCARRMLERKVDGVAVMTFAGERRIVQRLVDAGIPVVSVDAALPSPLSSTLHIDYSTGIAEAVQHLAVLGHRGIAFISGPLQLRSARARQQAFLHALRSIGITARPEWLIEGDHTLEGGMAATRSLLALRSQPTAIMCSNDMTAIGVQHALFEADKPVPGDFSIIGFDDIHLAEFTLPPLTTVRMSCTDLARTAVAELLAHMPPAGALRPKQANIPTRLVVRRTTDVPRNALRDLRRSRPARPARRPR